MSEVASFVERTMHISIVIPVLNEEAVLEATLARLTRQAGGQHYELIIVDGGSSDSTVAIAERYGLVISSSRGRATQMNAGATVASGDVLLFLHADTQIPVNAFCAIVMAIPYHGSFATTIHSSFNYELRPNLLTHHYL